MHTLTQARSAGVSHVWVKVGQVMQAATQAWLEEQFAVPPQADLHELTQVLLDAHPKVAPPPQVVQLGMQAPTEAQ